MSDREKLIALMEEAYYCSIEELANHLISHGVTFAVDNHVISNAWGDGFKQGYGDGYKVGFNADKWIPVTERLPDLELVEAMSNDKDFYPCLAVIKHERLMGRRYISKLWYDKNGFIDGDCIDRTSNVTHWMPLPEPPADMRRGENDA